MNVRTKLLGLAMVFALVATAYAEEKTLKGTITCAKCDLKLEKACASVIQVKEGDKTVTYWLDPAKGKEHKDICSGGKPGSVTGDVTKKGDKFTVKVKDFKFD